jgi:hypothetical protein
MFSRNHRRTSALYSWLQWCVVKAPVMTYLGRLTFATTVILLIGGGIWANLVKTPLPEMRGLWVTQAMRGMAY